jgi:hypothetical protein
VVSDRAASPAERANGIECLARRLYWKMDQLDPGETFVPWADLPEHDRKFYVACVTDLLGFEELIRRLI